MSSFSRYTQRLFLNYVLGRADLPPPPSGLFLGCFAAPYSEANEPTDVTALVSESGLRPQLLMDRRDSLPGITLFNAAKVIFGLGPSNATVASMGIWDASLGGNLLMWANLTSPVQRKYLGQFNFASDRIQFSLNSPVASYYLKSIWVEWLLGSPAPPASSGLYAAPWQGDPGPYGDLGSDMLPIFKGPQFARHRVDFGDLIDDTDSVYCLSDPVELFASANQSGSYSHLVFFDSTTGGSMLWRIPNRESALTEIDEGLPLYLDPESVTLRIG